MRIFTLFILCILLGGCGSPQSLEDFREEGQAITRSLLKTLRKIRSDEELSAAIPVLSKHYEDLVTVMIAAHRWIELRPEALALPLSKDALELNAALSEELNRLYRLERGRVLMERAQEKSLQRLDAFLQQAKKIQTKKHIPPINY